MRLIFRVDCHGLPIELMVEKKVGKPGQKVTAAEFREKCREYAAGQVEGQKRALSVLVFWASGISLIARWTS